MFTKQFERSGILMKQSEYSEYFQVCAGTIRAHPEMQKLLATDFGKYADEHNLIDRSACFSHWHGPAIEKTKYHSRYTCTSCKEWAIFVDDLAKLWSQSHKTVYDAGRMIERGADKAGYVYLLTHPLHLGWVKIGSTTDPRKRLSTYQTSDPFRKYEMRFQYPVDDRVAFENWVLFNFKKTEQVLGEWVEIVVSDAIFRTEEYIKLMKEN